MDLQENIRSKYSFIVFRLEKLYIADVSILIVHKPKDLATGREKQMSLIIRYRAARSANAKGRARVRRVGICKNAVIRIN